MERKEIKEHIQELYPTMPSTVQRVAKYVCANYDRAFLLGSSELASAVGVSDTTVIRFAKILGFKGYLEYKNALKAEYASVQKVYSYLGRLDLTEGDTSIPSYLKSIPAVLENFSSTFDFSGLDKICDTIIECKTLYLLGLGSDAVVAVFLKNYLPLMGIHCVCVTSEGLALREKMFLLDKNDVVLLSSSPTLLDDERWASEYTKKKFASLIVLTDSKITAQELRADYSVCFQESTDTFFNSYILSMAFCNSLLLRLYERNKATVARTMQEYQNLFE